MIPEGYVACPNGCAQPVLSAFLAAHLRRDAGTDWISERRPVTEPRPGLGSRSRRDRDPRGGEGRPQRRWKRPRGAGPYR